MNEDQQTSSEAGPSVADLQRFLQSVADPSPASDDAARLDRIKLLEQIKAAVAAEQARETIAFKQSRVAERSAEGLRGRELTKGIGSEIALARQDSPYWGSRYVGLAAALVHEMPVALAALSAGDISEYAATVLVAETACLSREHRSEVDRQLAGRLAGMSTKQLRAEAKRIGYRLDPHSVVDRARRAEADRRVTSWPVPDTMMNVCALLPVTQGVSVMAALSRAADASRAAGDERSRGQVMADTFVQRLTGQTAADQTPVEIQLVMGEQTLFEDDQTPAVLAGHGPLPAACTRSLLRGLDDETPVWIRRVFTDPCTGLIAGIDTRRRAFTGIHRRALIIRDQWCRTPWCGAPIRHADHVVAVEDGGSTSEANGQGLCEACNYAKQARGWRASPGDGGAGKAVTVTTPTGHVYTSRPPPIPGAEPAERADPGQEPWSVVVTEVRWGDVLEQTA